MHKTFRMIAKHIRQSVQEIKWIDRDKGQLEKPETFNSVFPPGVLLGFSEVDWIGTTRGNQTGLAQITVKLIFSLPAATFEDADWNEYAEYEILTARLYETLSGHPLVKDRRSTHDYFTNEFYVAEQVFDLEVYQVKEIKIIDKPAPQIQATLNIPIQ